MSENQEPSGWLDHDPADPAIMDREKADESILNLLDIVEKDVRGWNPEPGDKIFGVVADITDVPSRYREPYPMITIETPSGRLVGVHCFHEVLRNEVERRLKRRTLKIGDRIAIAYRGELEAKGDKNPANMYRIAIAPKQ